MKTIIRYVLVLMSAVLLVQPSLIDAAMEDYCLVPPYVKRDTSVNIMLLFDNSTDMEGPAYGNTYSPNAAKDNYYGYFDPRGCYNPNISSRFERVGAVNYTTNPVTGCDDAGKTLYNGNILNWATMSRFAVAKKVINGGRYTSVPVPQFTFEGADWASKTAEGCTWDVDGSGTNITLNVTEPTAGSCAYQKNTSGWNLTIRQTTEPTTGVLQEFADVNNDNNFDSNAPRFGLTVFTNTGVNIQERIPPGDYGQFHNSIKTMTSSARNNDLASALFTIVEYFDTESCSTNTDPYKDCSASWEVPPCVDNTAVPCRKSFTLMLTSGGDVGGKPYPSGTSCTNPDGSCLKGNAAYAYNNDLRVGADMPGKQNILTYIVQTFGTGTNDCATATGNIKTLCDAANTYGGGKYYSADTYNLAAVLREALQDILKRAAAGTAASVLASGEGSGANLIQAVFYPRKKFGNDEIAWIGRLTNFWYYVDPLYKSSAIYEDNASTGVLNLTNDNKITLYFDTTNEKTMADRIYDSNNDGVADTAITPDIEFENLTSLWEAGKLLWSRTSARTIKTTIGGSLIDFSTGNASTIKPYLALPTTDGSDEDTYLDGDIDRDGDVDDTDASILIRYVHGEDFSSYIWLRSRSVTIDGAGPNVWKLGDVLNSTPKVSSWIQLNTYDSKYSDTSYGEGTTGGFINTSNYKNRGMVFAGANDGMLHAFKLGALEVKWTGQGTYEKARLTGSDLGEEMWAFIPKNVLPYLKYMTELDYCHIYTVDLTPYIFDASIGAPGSGDISNNVKPSDGSTWRTILIGGMRFGGACKNSCTTTDCVATPAANLGYSSYFALDVTDQNNPVLLWEFSNENLGFTTTGPAVVRISARTDGSPDKTKNGHWFVVFGSGPTGPITGSGSTDYQFLGRSDQSLKLFVLDLKTGALLRTFGDAEINIPNAFAGSMLNSTLDTDLDYQDDVVYIPYVKKSGDNTWTDGGIGRLLTKEDTSPSNWVWSKVIDGIGPVTSSVVNLQNQRKGILWLYFGTGRYYFEQLATVDDQNGQRQLFGIKEPCFSSTLDTTCTTLVSSGDLTNVTDIANVPSESTANSTSFKGWYINLDASGNYTYLEGTPPTSVTRDYRAEREITDPLATTTGLVFFTTYKPYSDVCTYGGKSFLWAVKYSTGGCAGALLKGKALIQVSTGSIEEINLSSALTEKGGRRSSALEGVPPTAQGLAILSTPPPVKRTIHMRER